ncbi:hypothetical protein TRIUR3_23939 [Triticum urartu]|uniref:Uncharacterized protein n=1 Tax=Triticum urartu TaxID=4572 RepID=M8A6X8_TRIUA|nr:hypothetical protein TRIUR3_23939 [Triticum urartu]
MGVKYLYQRLPPKTRELLLPETSTTTTLKEFGFVKFIYVCVRLHTRDSSSTSTGHPNVYERCTTPEGLGYRQVPAPARLHGRSFHYYTETARSTMFCCPVRSRQVPEDHIGTKYIYAIFRIAKNVKHPFEMKRPTSSNDPKYLSENKTYTATVARIETDKSEDASTTPNQVGSGNVAIVRTRSTTPVCLLHGLLLLPCGISGKMTIPSKSLLSLLASCSLFAMPMLRYLPLAYHASHIVEPSL